MKILHTSDWHLGRQFHGQSLEADHQVVLDQVFQALVRYTPDVLIIAGDIFDRASPPTTAVRQFNEFIERVAQNTETAIVMIAGNHDSGDRIGSMGMLTDRHRALVRGPLSADERPLILEDTSGPVAFSALPFAYEYAARECFEDSSINSPEDVIRAQICAARKHIPESGRWVIVAHAFVAGANASESERPLGRVGGIETVPADAFHDAHYVALGHLHRPQSVGADHIRYSGSPLAFGYDEAATTKSMTLVDLGPDGTAETELLPFVPLRAVRTLRGKLSDLVATQEPSDDFVKIVLTDPGSLIDPMKQIRQVYPNAGPLTYERDETPQETISVTAAQSALSSPTHVISEFLTYVRGEPENPDEAKLIEDSLSELREQEA